MELRTFELPPIGTNAYLLVSPDRGEAALFDAPLQVMQHVSPVLNETGCRLVGLYLTHGHWDHTLETAHIRAAKVPVHCHEEDRILVEEPCRMDAFLLPGIRVAPAVVDRQLIGGDVLQIAGEEVEVRHVPGHSVGSVLYYFRERGVAIGGDAVFRGGVGRTDLPGGSFETLERSIREQIFTLPGATIIYPGHGPCTTVDEERRSNPFVHV